MVLSESDLQAKLAAIKLLVLDVDGVLTDGRLLLGDDGREFRSFDVKDGFGIRALRLSGIKVAVISGRESEVVKRRCENLGIEDVYQKVLKKHEAFQGLLEKYGTEAREACFIGDDVNDIALLARVGLSVCVADASPELKEVCDIVTLREGGRGAVREIAEKILKAQGRWNAIVAEFS
jgi:3-deoxy-D-manno-octulosonate 8-phosphate phosphatase (KDO 8-P phosphatase)